MNKNIQPLLTIIIPSYNHEKYIEVCIVEALKINISKKIIIIDDGSTDNTAIVIRNFILNNKTDNIEFIEKKNNGLISSLNLGLSKTTTKYVYFIASDDIPNPIGIKKVIELLEKNKNIDFIIGGGKNFFENGKKTKIYTNKHKEFFSLPFEKMFESLFLDYPSPLLLQTTIFQTKLLNKIGGWDTSLILDDYPIFVKLLSNKRYTFKFIPSIEIVDYRHHGVNTYKNIEKQFFMVNQALTVLAPDNLKFKAIGNKLGYYLLKSLNTANLKVFFNLLSIAPSKTYIYALRRIIIIISKKIKVVKK